MCAVRPRIPNFTKTDAVFVEDLFLQRGDQICIPQVWFTGRLWPGHGDCRVNAVCSSSLSGDQFELPDEALYQYKKRFQSKPSSRMRKVVGFSFTKSPF